MTPKRYLFNHLPAAQLVAHLVQALAHYDQPALTAPWHVCWLHNAAHPVIGLLPKVAWTLLPAPSQVLASANEATTCLITSVRQQGIATQTQTFTTYPQWLAALVGYADAHADVDSGHLDSAAQSGYTQGLMGFIGYDVSACQLSPASNIGMANQPAAFLGHYDIYLTPDTAKGWRLHIGCDTAPSIVAMVEQRLQQIEHALNQQRHNPLPALSARSFLPFSVPYAKPLSIKRPAPPLTLQPFALQPQWDYNAYSAAFHQVVDYLYSGDSYQINLTQQWAGYLGYPQAGQPPSHQAAKPALGLCHYLPALQQNTQPPYGGYLHVSYCHPNAGVGANMAAGTKQTFEIISCSPELFMVFSKDTQGQHHISTKPIKGTRPRGTNEQEDNRLKKELENSDKDRAENVMIVDLLRNDLGKYAKTGSVQVPELFAIESFSNVHHMVSTVTATIKDEVHPLTVLFDSLPAGSITGTPKKRAVEIISELEVDARGAYCGTLGFMNFDGTGQWNVLIRTLQGSSNDDGLYVNLWAGGGITVGSECAAEYQECRDKVGNLLAVLTKQAD